MEIEDNGGETSASIAQYSDLPGVLAYAGGYSSTPSPLTTFNYSFSGWGPTTNTQIITWSQPATNIQTPLTFTGDRPYSYSWVGTVLTPYSCQLVVTADFGGVFGGTLTVSGQALGDVWDPTLNPYWNNASGYATYGLWSGGLKVDPGIHVTNLTVLATSAKGAVVNYPGTFTPGGPEVMSYSIPSGSQFPIGTTAVTATATDDSQRTSTATFNVTVLPATPIAVSSSAPAAVTGQPVTLTATLGVAGPGGVTPTGRVTFMDGATAMGTGTLRTTGGVTTATFSTSALAVGSHTITAVYAGDGHFGPLTSTPLWQSVAPDATTTALTSSAAATNGQAVTFTATVLPAAPGAGVATGTVQFLVDGGDYGSPVPLTGGVAKISIAQWLPGTHTISAAYSGDPKFIGSASGTIATYAGDGTQGSAGDGGPATAAQLAAPAGLARDAAGDLFIADSANNRVREVIKSTGAIITVAGNGTAGYNGDGGPAAAAELNAPSAVALDAAGDLFIADSGNNRIREVVAATGAIVTYAGTGVAGGGDGGPAKQAQFNGVAALDLDAAGDLFIADSGNNRIREVVAATGAIQTVAGTGAKGFGGDGGLATAALLNGPTGVALDAAGNLYIADTGNNRVREVTKGIINTVAGSGSAGYGGDGAPARLSALNGPSAIAVDALGDLLIADVRNNRLREVLAGSGTIVTLAGHGSAASSGDGGPSAGAEIDVPDGLAIDALGHLFVSESLGNRVRELALSAPIGIIVPSATALKSSLSSSV